MGLQLIDRSILDKYQCEMDGLERIYHVSLDQKNYDLKFSNLVYFQLGDFICNNIGWQKLVIKLIEQSAINFNLLKFRPRWSKTLIFTAIPTDKKHEIKIKDGLYFNCSTLNNHLYQLIRDLSKLTIKQSNQFKWTVEKMPKAEPESLKEAIIQKMKEMIKAILVNKEDENTIMEFFGCIKAVNNRLTEYNPTAFNNLYLISNKEQLRKTIKGFLDKLKTNPKVTEDKYSKVEKYLNLYKECFSLAIDVIRHPDLYKIKLEEDLGW